MPATMLFHFVLANSWKDCMCVRLLTANAMYVCVSSNGIELVFVGTKSGLTRYLTLADNLSDPSVLSAFNTSFTNHTAGGSFIKHLKSN